MDGGSFQQPTRNEGLRVDCASDETTWVLTAIEIVLHVSESVFL